MRKAVLAALATVQDPELGKDLVSLGMIEDVAVSGGKASFRIVLTSPACPLRKQIQQAAEEAVRAVPGIEEVHAQMDAKVPQAATQNKEPIEGIAQVIAVASGKGGVGKSTVSVNIALALAASGAKVGLLDADIYGPNVPIMLGLSGRAPVDRDKKRILPMTAHGIKVISMGILTPEGAPVIWRGPLVASAVRQLLRDVYWGELDYLIVDLPPGTGDAQLTLCQQIPLAGAVIVTTPQQVSVADATRAIAMFDRIGVPVIGVVENMSTFVCPHCDGETEMFGSHGVRELCERESLELLGEIPLDPKVWAGGDGHGPVLVTDPMSLPARVLVDVAETVAARVSRSALLGRSAAEAEGAEAEETAAAAGEPAAAGKPAAARVSSG